MDKFVLLSLLSTLASVTYASYYEKIEAFSFDSSLGEYPLTYKTFGAAISTGKDIKLIPATKQRNGAIFLNQPISTTDLQVILDLEIEQLEKTIQKDEQNGLAIWYLHYKPKFPEQFGNDLGYIIFNVDFTDPESMGCVMSQYKSGKLKLMIQVLNGILTVQYSVIPEKEDGLTIYNQCVNQQVKNIFNYQGFFGLTATNINQINPNKILNNISLKSVEFYNMNVDYYKNVKGIEKRDYFNAGQRQPRTEDDENTQPDFVGKLRIQDLKKNGIDALEYKRVKAQAEAEQEKVDMSNILEKDTVEEIVFKMFEQIKAYNMRLTRFNAYQREAKASLKNVDDIVLKDKEYKELSKELEYADHAIREISLKVQNLQKDLNRIIDITSNLISTRSQNMGSIEYYMSPSVITNLANVQKEMGRLDQQFTSINRGRQLGASALETFLLEFIKSFTATGIDLDIDVFSQTLNKKFDSRMEQYQRKVQSNTFQKNMTQTILTSIACLSVFGVWMKLRSMQKQYLF